MFLLFLMTQAAVLLHVTASMLFGAWNGIARDEVSLWIGPRLAGFAHLGTRYTLRAIPLGGLVRFDEASFLEAPSWRRVLIPVATLAVMSGAGLILVGGLEPAWSAVGAVAHATVQPSDGVIALRVFCRTIADAPAASLGAVLVCSAAFNALPLRTLDGGAVLLTLVSGDPARGPAWLAPYSWASLLAVLAIVGVWLYIAIAVIAM